MCCSENRRKLTGPLAYDNNGDLYRYVDTLPSGNYVYVKENDEQLRKVDPYGNRIGTKSQLLFQEPPQTVKYLTLYPNGTVYEKSDGPVKVSSYGLENLIQIKITCVGDKIISKEFC